jgi:hypothetical protein
MLFKKPVPEAAPAPSTPSTTASSSISDPLHDELQHHA